MSKLSETPEVDAAERFYRQSYERQRGLASDDTDALRTLVQAGNHRYSEVYNVLRGQTSTRALEMGYGGPAIVELIAPLTREYHIIDVIDRTDETSLPANVTSHLGNLDHSFPFSDEEFDVVIAMMVIEHLYDPFHAFSETARIARPGGDILINLPNIAAFKCRLQLLIGKMPVTSTPDWFDMREWDGGHLHYFTVANVLKIAALSGLELIKIAPVGKLSRLKRLRPSLLCHEITYHFRKLGRAPI